MSTTGKPMTIFSPAQREARERAKRLYQIQMGSYIPKGEPATGALATKRSDPTPKEVLRAKIEEDLRRFLAAGGRIKDEGQAQNIPSFKIGTGASGTFT